MIWHEPVRKVWKLRGVTGEYVIVRRRDLREYERPSLDPMSLSAQVEQWLADPVMRSSVLDMCRSVANGSQSGLQARTAPAFHGLLKPQLDHAFRRGELVALRVQSSFGSSSIMVETEPAGPPETAGTNLGTAKKHWIAFEIVDEDTDEPVEGVKLMVRLPDGKTQAFVTNDHGKIEIRNLEEGTCDVSCSIQEAELEKTRKVLGFF